MKCTVISDTKGFLKLKNDWEDIQKNNRDLSYYSTFEFLWEWWSIYKEDPALKLQIIIAENNNKLVGIAPLIIEERKKYMMNYKVIKFMGRGDYKDFILDYSEKNQLTILKYLFRQIEEIIDWDKIELTHIKHSSFLAKFMLRSDKFNNSFSYLSECPVINLNNKKISDYYSIMPKRTRTSRNKLKKETDYQFFCYKSLSKENDFQVFNEISETHIKQQRYLKKNDSTRISLFEDDRTFSFFEKLYCCNPNTLTFMLKNKDEIITYSTGYISNRTFYDWNIGHNPKFLKYNLTKVRMYEIIEYLTRNNLVDYFDWGAGRYPWKFEWTNESNILYQLNMWNSSGKNSKIMKQLVKIKQTLNVFNG